MFFLFVFQTKDDNGKQKSIKKKTNKGVSSLQTSLLCLILSGTIFTLFISIIIHLILKGNFIEIILVLYTDQIPWHIAHRAVDLVAKVFGYHKPVYGVVIDAGSTGSRVLAFTFHESYFGKKLNNFCMLM